METNNTQYTYWVMIKDIWVFIRPYKGRFWFATFIRAFSSAVWLYPVWALAYMIDFFKNYEVGNDLSTIWLMIVIWIIASVVHFVGRHLGKYHGNYVGERASFDASLQTTAHIFNLDISWHEKENAGNRLKRIQKGQESIAEIVRIWFWIVIEAIVYFIGMITIIGSLNLLIGGVLVFFLLSYSICSYYLTRWASDSTRVVNIQEEEVTGVTFEAINNIRTVKVLDLKKPVLRIVKQNINNLFEKVKVRFFRFTMRQGFLDSWAQIIRLGTSIFIIYQITKGNYEIGFLVLFYEYFNRVWVSLDQISKASQDIAVAKYSIYRMGALLNEPVTIDDERGKRPMPKEWKSIRLKDVSFAYGSNKNDNGVLRNITLDIKRGEKIGIVGLSGAGKSTLFKLLLKEHEGFDGQILIDEMPIQDIKKSDYFKHVAVVLQDTEVFNFTLRDNVTIAGNSRSQALNSKSSASGLESDLKRALEIAHVEDFLDKMPRGLETQIGEKGVRLSGGERQRVGIARAVFKQPEILFLDEATSHLDLESEEKIQDSLHRFFKQVTAVVIAHRLTTIKEMDRILVIQDGGIVEEGSFAELYDKKKRFFELWEKQKL